MQQNPSLSTSSRTWQWAETATGVIHAQLSDTSHPSISDLDPCGPIFIDQLHQASSPFAVLSEAHRILRCLEIVSEESIKLESVKGGSVSLHSRRLYTECRLLRSLLDLRDPDPKSEEDWEHSVTRLDMAIVVAGAPGEGRLDLILDTIELIQAQHLPMREVVQNDSESPRLNTPLVVCDTLKSNHIPRISPPSISTFRFTSSSPFILPGFINDWPALTDHPWSSPSYLLRIAGRGRVVPVELGSDYRAEEWSQTMVSWEAFLRNIGMDSGVECRKTEGINNIFQPSELGKEVLYLAQHTLLTQFPALRSDIIVPDYVYSSLPPPSMFPSYRPPGNAEELVINAWLGPKGTLSPAHTDLYYNCYAQVVGRKTVWLAPPHFQREMYPFPGPNAPHTTRSAPTPLSTVDDTASEFQHTIASLSNTSRVDVFSRTIANASLFPLFESDVRPHALCAVLEPGDLLYIPPGWWHAMRSEDLSFSVSMWF